MTRQQIELKPGQFITLAMDDDIPPGMRQWAIVQLRLLNDTTSQPVRSPVTIVVEQRGLTPRVVGDGLVGLVGRPLDLFPDLDSQGYPVDFTVYAAGYQPRNLSASILQTPGFPNTFTTTSMGDIHLQPV